MRPEIAAMLPWESSICIPSQPPPIMEMSTNENVSTSCDPANPRRSLVPGPESVKLVTEDLMEVGDQASITVNATGSKKLTQQAFHRSMFITRPRTNSSGCKSPEIPPAAAKSPRDTTQPQATPTNSPSQKDTVSPPSWQKVPGRNPKRKKPSNSPESIATSNMFSQLPIDLTEEPTATKKNVGKKPSKPPPIILYGIEDVNKLTELVETVADKSSFTYRLTNRNQLRINTLDIEAYQQIITKFRENGLIGHTFNKKEERPCRIVIRNLHHTTPISEIKKEMEKTGNTVVGEIINSRFGPEKKPTSTFFVNLQPGPNNKAAKDIKYIYHQCVTIEDPKKKNSIVQCQRCQQYGHTKNYCMKPYRCVKCAQSHKTSDCPKRDRNTPAQCALCNGTHPANYKGCEVYREILARKNNKFGHQRADRKAITITKDNSGPDNINPPRNTTQQRPSTDKREKPLSYAKATRNEPEKVTTENLTPRVYENQTALETLLMKQNEKFDLILQQMSTLMNLIATLITKLQD